AQALQYGYGSVGVVQVNAGKLHTLRVWVKRPAGWRLLVYQEVKSLDTPPAAAAAPPASAACENPCGALPYAPNTAAHLQLMKAQPPNDEAAMSRKAHAA